MAYVGNTARLCQAIVDGDLEHVAGWLSQEGVDPNTRDYTGRTPLHLAVMSSTPEIVRALIDGGARLVARLADGRTALHLAAARGEVQMVKMLLDKSASNEAEHEEKQDQRRREKKATKTEEGETNPDETKDRESDGGEDSDGELVDDVESDDEAQSMATGSFVKVGKKEVEPLDDLALGDDEEEPDFYDINVIAWDTPCSALHFAIVEGHVEVVKTLVQVCKPSPPSSKCIMLTMCDQGIRRRCSIAGQIRP
jgi:ankyrin repeat protein